MASAADVIVVGSGAAGMAAALGAAQQGAQVLVLESATEVGGTTALSGGVVWAPGHGRSDRDNSARMAADDRAAARNYLLNLATGDVVPELVEVFVSKVGPVISDIEQLTPLEWEVLEHWPDYRTDLDGASQGGRSLWPKPMSLSEHVMQRVQGDIGAGPAHVRGPAPDNDGEVLRGPVRGRALVGALLAGAEALGVEVRTAARVSGLSTHRGVVTGVQVDGESIDGTVVLATGGFQFDPGSVATFLSGAPCAPMGTPGCTGDGLRLAQAMGAALGNMAEGWWMPALAVPGEELGGSPYHRPLHSERAQPGALLVDRHGRRFVDEAQNYGDVGRAMRRFGSGTLPYPAAPCWMVFDSRYRRRYPVGPLTPSDADPSWLVRGEDEGDLARAIGVPPGVLAETLERFNVSASKGEDPDFGRGGHHYDRWIGDAEAAHPTLAPLTEAPLYACAVHAGCMGTKGGPRTDGEGRVLVVGGRAIEGLFAAGNAAASPFGTATAAGGATLGPALCFGYLAGQTAGR